MSHTIEKLAKIQKHQDSSGQLENSKLCSKAPNCPYTHLGCIKYDHVLKHGVCQPHANKHHKSVRCCWLPSWVPDGWHLAVLRGGQLYVRRGVGGR